jgi:hypothetical protein
MELQPALAHLHGIGGCQGNIQARKTSKAQMSFLGLFCLYTRITEQAGTGLCSRGVAPLCTTLHILHLGKNSSEQILFHG